MIYYVYGHINPITNKFFYIGKGTGERYVSSIGRNEFWHNTVNKYGFAAIKIVDGLSEREAFEIEKQYIAKHGLRIHGGVLVNLTYGGTGGRTVFDYNIDSMEPARLSIQTNMEQYRIKCRESKLGAKNPNYGKKTWLFGKSMPDETKKKLSDARKGYKMPEDVKEKVLKGLAKAAAAKIKNSYKVQCLILNKTWLNRKECMNDLNMNLKVFQQRIFRNRPIKGNHLQYIKN